jgi:hypothetical protein
MKTNWNHSILEMKVDDASIESVNGKTKFVETGGHSQTILPKSNFQ